MKLNQARPIEILLVEDSEGDVVLTREAFDESRIAVNITAVSSGQSALEMLGQRRANPPDLVLLDLNLPGISGHEVLRRIKEDEELTHIPVLVLTSSQAPDDVLGAYRGHANSFISKPINPSEFLQAVKTIESYWLTVVRLPSQG